MGKTYHAPGKASQAPAGQAPGKPSTPSGRAPGKNVPRAFGPRTGETLTTHLRSTHWRGIMARAFGPSTLDNLPHASATRPGQTTRWGKTCRAPSGHAPGGKHATRRRATYQGKHATRLRSRKRKTCHMPLGHAPKETCRTPSGHALGSTCHSPSGHAPGRVYHTRRPMRPGQPTYTSGPLVRGKTWHAYSGKAPRKPYDTLWDDALRKQH